MGIIRSGFKIFWFLRYSKKGCQFFRAVYCRHVLRDNGSVNNNIYIPLDHCVDWAQLLICQPNNLFKLTIGNAFCLQNQIKSDCRKTCWVLLPPDPRSIDFKPLNGLSHLPEQNPALPMHEAKLIRNSSSDV